MGAGAHSYIFVTLAQRESTFNLGQEFPGPPVLPVAPMIPAGRDSSADLYWPPFQNDTERLEIVELFRMTKQNVSLHGKNIFEDNELALEATVRDSLTVQSERYAKSYKRLVPAIS